MSSDPEPIVQQIAAAREEFEQLIEMVTGPTAFECTAGHVERSLWRKLLALGAPLLRLFFCELLLGLRQDTVPPALLLPRWGWGPVSAGR